MPTATMATAAHLNPSSTLFLRYPPSPSPSLLRLPRLPSPPGARNLRLRAPRRLQGAARASSAIAGAAPPPSSSFSVLAESTRTLSSLLALSLAVFKALLSSARRLAERAASAAAPSPEELSQLRSLQGTLAWAVGPLFFAARGVERPPGSVYTPLTVVISRMARWLDIYTGLLMVRVLLSWFPNMPWDTQPFSAIRDVCDPYLSIFRKIIPPVFNSLDISPLLAFAVLGIVGNILNSRKMM